MRITSNIKVIHPPLSLPGFGGAAGGAMRAKMHAKLMILRYRDHTLRVVITSANLTKPVRAHHVHLTFRAPSSRGHDLTPRWPLFS